MKKIVPVICLMLASLLVKAQSGDPDKRLLSKFSEKQLNEMKLKNVEEYNYWNFYAANAYRIIDLPKGKESAPEIGGSVTIKDMNNINVFELKLIKGVYYYKIEGSDKIINVFTENQMKEKFAQSKKK